MAFYFDAEDGATRSESPLNEDHYPEPTGHQYFKRRLHEEVLRSQRRQHAFTLLRLAVEASSKNPEEMIALIVSAVREYDLVCHLQLGDYAIVLPETSEKYAEKIAERIKQIVAGYAKDYALSQLQDARIGIACFPYDGTNAEDLILSAEQDLFHQRT